MPLPVFVNPPAPLPSEPLIVVWPDPVRVSRFAPLLTTPDSPEQLVFETAGDPALRENFAHIHAWAFEDALADQDMLSTLGLHPFAQLAHRQRSGESGDSIARMIRRAQTLNVEAIAVDWRGFARRRFFPGPPATAGIRCNDFAAAAEARKWFRLAFAAGFRLLRACAKPKSFAPWGRPPSRWKSCKQ